MKNIEIIGAGIVGMATGESLERKGFPIQYIDVDPVRVQRLVSGGKKAFFPTNAPVADISLVCVQTPTLSDGSQDLSHLITCCNQLKARLNHSSYNLIIVRSTILPFTTNTKLLPIFSNCENVGLCIYPEFLREKNAVQDAQNPRVIIFAASDKRASKAFKELFIDFGLQIELTFEDVEFHKYVHNTFNAIKIAFFNEMRSLGKQLDVNCQVVFDTVAITSEAMWNPQYGIRDWGPFSGGCLPKDINALLNLSDRINIQLPIVHACKSQNESLEASNLPMNYSG